MGYKNPKTLLRGGLALFAVMLAGLLSGGLQAYAVTAPQPQRGGASGLSISPLRSELTLKPGEAEKVDITLKNITGVPIVARVTVQDFTSDNNSGIPKIITDSKIQSPFSIKKFLVNPTDVNLAVGQQRTFSIPIQVPQGTAPGAYFGLVAYQAEPANAGNTSGNNRVALSAAVSQLVLLSVPGDVSERMQLDAIHVYKDKEGTSEGILFTQPPKSLGVEVSNLGNSFVRPFGQVGVQGTSGKQIYSYEMNGGIVRSIVLPNSKRIFKNEIKNIKNPGRYTVVTNLSYGTGSAILTGKKTFWYIPVWLLAIIIALIALIIGAIFWARRRFKRSTKSKRRRYLGK
jgi:hypothetical protein